MSDFLGAVAPAIGSIVGGVLAYKGQKDTNATNIKLSKEQEMFQERMANTAYAYQTNMSNTAYQRAMADMREAGLNPMLAYSQGGASTPIGQTPAGSLTQIQNPYGAATTTAQAIAQTASTAYDVPNKHATYHKTVSELLNHREYRKLTRAQQDVAAQVVSKSIEEIRLLQEQYLKTIEEKDAIQMENVQRRIMEKFYTNFPFSRVAREAGLPMALIHQLIEFVRERIEW